jgi:hypothetical protein
MACRTFAAPMPMALLSLSRGDFVSQLSILCLPEGVADWMDLT